MNTWVEIDKSALEWNLDLFRNLIGNDRLLMAVVKANAYGHGAVEVAQIASRAGTDWLGVFSIDEGLTLRKAGLEIPILVLGPPQIPQLEQAFANNLRLTVPSLAIATKIAKLAPKKATVHLKIETGTNRLGLIAEKLIEAFQILRKAGVEIEGACTHFADIEDTTDHTFAEGQLAEFETQLDRLQSQGAEISIPHTACSAAAILFPQTYFKMVRVGISLYGLWPSRETLVSAQSLGRNAIEFKPAMTWKTRIAQIKNVASGAFIGYGRSFRTTRPSRIAVLPIGYADGYDRHLSGSAHVLIRGMRADVRGRVCMNLIMVDVTDIDGVAPGDEVVLLGTQDEETVSAEDLARWTGTINYEIVTRIADHVPRVVVS
jgi:alanine racemase